MQNHRQVGRGKRAHDGEGSGGTPPLKRSKTRAPAGKRNVGSSSSSSGRWKELQLQRKRLPITVGRSAILEEVRGSQCVIIVGETGSGKTTQIPQYLMESGLCKGHKRIAVTQPRRVAAMTVSKRVSEEVGCRLGDKVGYSVRFDDCSSERTLIKYVTDGTLLREAITDDTLSEYSVVILDEAHERSLHTDVLFGLVKQIMKRRHDLKVIVMSATLQAESFSSFFNDAPVLFIEGRQFPVDVFYAEESPADYLDAAMLSVLQIHMEESSGDILAFLTGQEEIEALAALLNEKARLLPLTYDKLLVCPIYAALPSEQQMLAFQPAPANTRKVILATNIAETSITINGVRFVVDCGLVKARGYNPKSGVDALAIIPISKAACRQRAGRAGREAPGKCFRLFTQESFQGLAEDSVPEIKRANLTTVVLQMMSMGIKDVLAFDFMDKPPRETLIRAMEALLALGALTPEGDISRPLGEQMAMFPVDPKFAKCLITAQEYGCLAEMIIITGMLSVENIFFAPKEQRGKADVAKRKFSSFYGDHLTLLKVYREFVHLKRDFQWCRTHFVNFRSMQKVEDVLKQLRDFCKRIGMNPESSCDEPEIICKCLTSGFFLNVAMLMDETGKFRTLTDSQEVCIHPSSVLFATKKPRCVLFNELVCTTKRYIRDVTLIEPSWLPEMAPDYFVTSTSVVDGGSGSSSTGNQRVKNQVRKLTQSPQSRGIH